MIAVNKSLKQYIFIVGESNAFLYALQLATTRGWKVEDVYMCEEVRDISDYCSSFEEYMEYEEVVIRDESDDDNDECDGRVEGVPCDGDEITQYQTMLDSDDDY